MGAHTIPRVIHIIWAGGYSLMNIQSIKNIMLWAINNPDFKITLWVDEKTSNKNIVALEKEYKQLFQGVFETQEISPEVNSLFKLENLEVKDIRSDERICQKNDPLIDYEIDRIDPNYGASSDILRYRILYNYGGMYVDHDVVPGQDSLDGAVPEFTENEKHVLYVDHLSQLNNEKVDSHQLNLFPEDWARVGNDIFICTLSNPLMEEFIKAAEKNYRLREDVNIREAAKLAYRSHDIKNNTIERTGPEVIRRTIQENTLGPLKIHQAFKGHCIKSLRNEERKSKVEIKPIKSNAYRLAKPYIIIKSVTKFAATNMESWLDVPPNFVAYSDTEKILTSFLQSIQFEQEYFGILRLDDHLTMLKTALKNLLDAPDDKLLAIFLEKVKEILNPDKLLVVQWLNLNQETYFFYEDNNLTRKIPFISSNEMGTSPALIFDWALAKEFFLGSTASLYNEEFLLKDEWVDAFNECYPAQEILRIFHRIERGIALIHLILKHPDNQAVETSTFLLDKYKIILQKAGQTFINYGVQRAAIKQADEKINHLIPLVDKAYASSFIQEHSSLSSAINNKDISSGERKSKNTPQKRKQEEEGEEEKLVYKKIHKEKKSSSDEDSPETDKKLKKL